jgi:uncharacterized protein (TIGR01777 family)
LLLKVAITGSSGFIGSALIAYLEKNGLEVFRLVRRYPFNSKMDRSIGATIKQNIFWNPETEYVDMDALQASGIDALVNLAGENVHQRWNRSNKKRLIVSRVRSTKLLGKAILQLNKRPKVFISASGISYYHNIETSTSIEGVRSARKHYPSHFLFDESAKSGVGFLSELCQEWERASNIGDRMQTQVRTVNLRIGVALGPSGGVLNKLLPIFKLGLGGKWGDGSQYMSWIGIDDLVRIIHFAITNDSIEGPVNAVSPYPVTNLEFTKILGRILSRPVVCSVPGWLARFVFGKEWVESTLLADLRVKPAALVQKGFKFEDPELEPFLTKKLIR